MGQKYEEGMQAEPYCDLIFAKTCRQSGLQAVREDFQPVPNKQMANMSLKFNIARVLNEQRARFEDIHKQSARVGWRCLQALSHFVSQVPLWLLLPYWMKQRHYWQFRLYFYSRWSCRRLTLQHCC